MHLSAVCFNFAQHNNEQTLHTLENTGFKTNQLGLGKRIHLGLILPSKFDCLLNPSLMDDLTQLMALFVSIIIFAFFSLCMKEYLQMNLNPLNFCKILQT